MEYFIRKKYYLPGIQANILKPHGKKYARFCFLSFGNSTKQRKIRRWLSFYCKEYVTSTWAQLKQPKSIITLSLTNRAYQLLGLGKHIPDDCSFVLGLDHYDVKGRLSIERNYLDWDKCFWNYKGLDSPTHALVMIAADSYDLVENYTNSLVESISEIGSIRMTQDANRLPRCKGHFGYVDGISQPKLLMKTKNKIESGNHIPLILKEEKRHNGGSYWPIRRYGSYFVFHKFRLYPDSFEKQVGNLHKRLEEYFTKNHPGIQVPTLEYIFAQIIGRFRDGTPLTKYNTPNNRIENSFDYSNDKGGLKCPFHAHIRKNNPRTDHQGREILIARRGMPYGTIEDRNNGKDVGLLFMSFQNSIVDQFERILLWSLDDNFIAPSTGFDPINGFDRDKKGKDPAQSWNVHYNKAISTKINFFDFDQELRKVIELKGAMYFYTPSISFLLNLKYGQGRDRDLKPKDKCKDNSYTEPKEENSSVKNH